MVSGPTTLATITTAKIGTTSKDKFLLSLTLPNTLVTTTMPKPAGSPRSATVHSSRSGFSAGPELKTTPLSPGTTTPQESRIPSPSNEMNLSSVQGQTKIVCENKMPPKEKAIILSLNESRPCNSLEGSPLKEVLKEVLCKALKPNYNQNRDDCTILLASDTEDLKRVAVIKTSVQKELHTIENGYHDNPTLEVMETLSEMQEKKVNLNGELGDSWIVPMDSLTKDELDEEEDTHL
ncbi:hypothetical protein E2320_004371 [Naja naja]|nr:hypothetical protein E2320_004371 [Naja naja]